MEEVNKKEDIKPEVSGTEDKPKRFAGRKRRNTRKLVKSDVNREVISARRVARVVAGGRRFSLSVCAAVGDGKGKVGLGLGKGPDFSIAVDKAVAKAKKNMIQVKMTKDEGIAHDVSAKYSASEVKLSPSNKFVAGGAARKIAELAGIKKVSAKIMSRSKNNINNAKAVIKALQKIKK